MVRFVWATLLLCQMGQSEIAGTSLGGSIDWRTLDCQLSESGRLNLSWGPRMKLSVTIPHFGSLLENSELVINIGSKNSGGVSFEDRKWWVTDPARHEESNCRLTLGEIEREEKSPVSFRAKIACKNLVPLDNQDGGLNDVEADSSRVFCHR